MQTSEELGQFLGQSEQALCPSRHCRYFVCHLGKIDAQFVDGQSGNWLISANSFSKKPDFSTILRGLPSDMPQIVRKSTYDQMNDQPL